MSYSRWSNSYWYTYWSSYPMDGFIYEDNKLCQSFTICGWNENFYFTYSDLKKSMGDCVGKVEAEDAELPQDADYRKDLLDELRKYMRNFMKDIEKMYGSNGVLYIIDVRKI